MSTKNSPIPVVLCVGGSDPSAHAGIQADIRVGQDLGVHVVTVVTSLTAQNSQSVSHVFSVAKQKFDAQWESILSDIEPNLIKIGLLPNAELIDATVVWIKKVKADFPDCQIVLDPVGKSSTGQSLSDEGDQTSDNSHLLKSLLPLVDWVTPNVDEFVQIVADKMEKDAQACIRLGLVDCFNEFIEAFPEFAHQQWLIKGGHVWGEVNEPTALNEINESNECTDWLFAQNLDVEGLSSPIGFVSKKQTQCHSRGTGCSFATALSAFLSLGYDALDSITLTKSYINSALAQSYQVGQGEGPLGTCGWPDKLELLPEIRLAKDDVFQANKMTRPFSLMAPDSLGLYPVVDSPEWIERLLKTGIKTIQLRIKDPESDHLEQDIKTSIALGKEYNAQVFINDYWQKAIEYGAYGVHLGQEDLLEADLAHIAKSGLRLGVSTHGYFEIARAQHVNPSYIALGHIFPTKTKDMPSQPQGVTRLAKYAALLSGAYPTVAIGGINLSVLDAVLRTNVDGIAMVTAITKAPDPEAVVDRLMQCIAAYKTSRKEALLP